MRIHDTDERLDRIRRVMQATGENTKSGAIDVALKHYLQDLENKRRVARKLSPEIADELSTPWVPMDWETPVGRTED